MGHVWSLLIYSPQLDLRRDLRRHSVVRLLCSWIDRWPCRARDVSCGFYGGNGDGGGCVDAGDGDDGDDDGEGADIAQLDHWRHFDVDGDDDVSEHLWLYAVRLAGEVAAAVEL